MAQSDRWKARRHRRTTFTGVKPRQIIMSRTHVPRIGKGALSEGGFAFNNTFTVASRPWSNFVLAHLLPFQTACVSLDSSSDIVFGIKAHANREGLR